MIKNGWTETLKELEKENAELKGLIKVLRKKLSRVDELALLIENATERIRNNI